MRFGLYIGLAASVVVSLLPGVFSSKFGRDGLTSPSADTCGEVDDVLSVPNPLLHGKKITIGPIRTCLCVSNIPYFMATNAIAISGAALAGRPTVITILTDMINRSNGHQTCYYPPHSVPACGHGSPCGFTCKDGYSPYPAGSYPTQCACNKPYTECNGKCGMFHACPSGHPYKRDLHKQCAQGLSACGVLGRNAHTWECVDTQNDLESCGGCVFPLFTGAIGPEGTDCTAIVGVSDVSCVRGQCAVHRCMPGYEIGNANTSCVYSEDKDPIILAAQYGLEHVPF